MKKYYLTTPLYYVNAKPHIGHAYTNVLADTFARYERFIGKEVFFLTGTDEHGTKIEKIAKEQKLNPRDFVEKMVPEFKSLWQLLDARYDYFIRTTDDMHKKVVANVLTHLEKTGDIYKALYKGWYCTPCESFWTELQLKGGKCPDCGREVQELSEENYFFKLSKYQQWLIDYINSHSDFIKPEMRRNEILGFLREPLEDLSISRLRTRLEWGIDYPTSKDHVVYVWFDALVNYISAVGYSLDDKKFKSLWPADLHLVGKDILRQHAVYWPIMLHALGLEMPKTILAHGWWTMSGAKVSKSRGNAVDPIELSAKYTTDAFRYFLLKEVTVGYDGAFSEDLLRERYSSDLANDLGNLWFRFASMLDKYFGGSIPKIEKSTEIGKVPLLQNTFQLWDKVHQAMQNFDPREALQSVWSVITQANQFVEERKPWVLAKDEAKKNELAETLVILGECSAHLAVILNPFLPKSGKAMLERMELPTQWMMKSSAEYQKPLLKPGTKIQRGEALFPRLEDEEKPLNAKK